jgi:FMN reductase
LSEGRPRLLVVLGSVTAPGRLCAALVEAIEVTARGGVEAELLDLADLGLGFADGRDPLGSPAEADAVAAVADADALVLATPVYRGSMTGALKNLLDLLPVESLRGKPVGIAAMGASQHHYLGADRHLRDVLSFFGALVAPVGAYLVPADFDDGAPAERTVETLRELLETVSLLAERLGGASLGPAPLASRAVRR